MLYDKDIREPLAFYLEEIYGKNRILEEQVMGQSRADMVIGSTPEALESIIAEQKAMTDNIAQGLEMVLGVSAGMWMNLQRAYDQAIKSE